MYFCLLKFLLYEINKNVDLGLNFGSSTVFGDQQGYSMSDNAWMFDLVDNISLDEIVILSNKKYDMIILKILYMFIQLFTMSSQKKFSLHVLCTKSDFVTDFWGQIESDDRMSRKKKARKTLKIWSTIGH